MPGLFFVYAGEMDRAAIRDEVRTRMGLSVTDQNIDNDALNSLINSSLRRVSVESDWSWTEVSGTVIAVKGNPVLPIPGVRKVRWVRFQDTEVRFRNYRDTADFYELVGNPQFYTEESSVYRLLPVPDEDYTLEYGAVLTTDGPLLLDTDEPAIPDWAIDILIADIGMLVARRLRDRELEGVYYAEYQMHKHRILDDQIQSSEGMLPRRVRRGPHYNS